MRILLEKFGTTLTSRQAGKEAFLALQPLLKNVKTDEKMSVDFSGVVTFSPSWGDEFLTPLKKKYPKLELLPTDNPSVKITLELLQEVWFA